VKRNWSSIDFLCWCLAVEINPSADLALRAAISSGGLNWGSILTHANEQLITPALWVALQKRGLENELPTEVRGYLKEVHRLNRLRNERLRAQAREAAAALNELGITPVLLKGTASLFVPIYDDPGSRVMLDLDILVPEEAANGCWGKLHDVGYSAIGCGRDLSRHHHLEPLQRPGEYATIEIHRDAVGSEAQCILPTGDVWRHCGHIDDGNVRMCVPQPTMSLLHNLVHAAVAHRGYETAAGHLRAIHELALTGTLQRDRIDWERIASSFRRSGNGNILVAWVYLAHRLFDADLPKFVRRTPSVNLYYLRYRLQARWPWTDALAQRLLVFSSRNVSERYQCGTGLVPLGIGRIRILFEVGRGYGLRAAQWSRRYLARASPQTRNRG
jgi:hypothetical protein